MLSSSAGNLDFPNLSESRRLDKTKSLAKPLSGVELRYMAARRTFCATVRFARDEGLRIIHRRTAHSLCRACLSLFYTSSAGRTRPRRAREVFRYGRQHDAGGARSGGLDDPAVPARSRDAFFAFRASSRKASPPREPVRRSGRSRGGDSPAMPKLSIRWIAREPLGCGFLLEASKAINARRERDRPMKLAQLRPRTRGQIAAKCCLTRGSGWRIVRGLVVIQRRRPQRARRLPCVP